MIRELNIGNYKSLDDVSLSLGNLVVFVGANGSGKSNIVDVLRFLHDSLTSNLSVAVGRRLGWRNVLTRGKPVKESIRLGIRVEPSKREIFQTYHARVRTLAPSKRKVSRSYPAPVRDVAYKPMRFNYSLEMRSVKDVQRVSREELDARWWGQNREMLDGFTRKRKSIKIRGNLTRIALRRSVRPTQTERVVTEVLGLAREEGDSLFLGSRFFSISGMQLSRFVRNWRFYELIVDSSRIPSSQAAEQILAQDGHNLSLVLDRLRRAKDQRMHRIASLMGVLVPEFESWETERQFDGRIGFKIKEKNISKGFFPEMISDGTIRLLGILVALLNQPESTTLISIDEPERCLHPQVLETLVEVMREVSAKTQVVLTTHSAEMAKWLKPDEIYMVDKKANRTRIVRGSDVPSIDNFMKEFSLDELWLAGYLKGGTIA